MRFFVARNVHTPPSTLGDLATDGNVQVRRGVASNPRAPLVVLQRLARDPERAVRLAVARNPVTPADLLAVLAQDTAWPVRMWVARHPAAPPDVLDRLAADDERSVRRAVARHPGLPAALHQRLAVDGDPVVSHLVARQRLTAGPRHDGTDIGEPHRAVAAADVEAAHAPDAVRPSSWRTRDRRAAPKGTTLDAQRLRETLNRLINRTDYDAVQWAVALAHPAIPREVLVAQTANGWIVRLAIAHNPQAPSDVLATLAEDVNRVVRAAARAARASRREAP